MPLPERIQVSVVYADATVHIVRQVEVATNSTVRDAIAASAILDALAPGSEPAAIGVFGVIVKPDAPVHAGDRIELYRLLRIDPKQSRRRRSRNNR